MSPDGRYVVFYSDATDLDPSQTSEAPLSVYVRDVQKATTRLVSTTEAGPGCTL